MVLGLEEYSFHRGAYIIVKGVLTQILILSQVVNLEIWMNLYKM
jgi:hypothetical protein